MENKFNQKQIKRVNFETLQVSFVIFLVLNLLTMPLSPYNPYGGKGLMSKEAYAPIMYVKSAIFVLFIIWFVVLLVMHCLFLVKKKKIKDMPDKMKYTLAKLSDELDAKGFYNEADGITDILNRAK